MAKLLYEHMLAAEWHGWKVRCWAPASLEGTSPVTLEILQRELSHIEPTLKAGMQGATVLAEELVNHLGLNACEVLYPEDEWKTSLATGPTIVKNGVVVYADWP